jgi:hypothetical protein
MFLIVRLPIRTYDMDRFGILAPQRVGDPEGFFHGLIALNNATSIFAGMNSPLFHQVVPPSGTAKLWADG